MDELKNYIENNRTKFDTKEPSEGHMERFMSKLQEIEVEPEKKVVKFSPVYLMKVASVCVLMILSGLYVKDQWFNADKQVPVLSGENYEAQQFYMVQVSDKQKTVEQLSAVMNEEEQELLLQELQEMDEVIKELQNQLQLMPNDERIVEALLKHYKTKLDILNAIIKDLNNVKKLKTNSHETIEL